MLSRTIYQIKNYSKEIAFRNSHKYQMLAHIIRAAYGSDRYEFDRFLESLEPKDVDSFMKPAMPSSVGGFVYKNEGI